MRHFVARPHGRHLPSPAGLIHESVMEIAEHLSKPKHYGSIRQSYQLTIVAMTQSPVQSSENLRLDVHSCWHPFMLISVSDRKIIIKIYEFPMRIPAKKTMTPPITT